MEDCKKYRDQFIRSDDMYIYNIYQRYNAKDSVRPYLSVI